MKLCFITSKRKHKNIDLNNYDLVYSFINLNEIPKKALVVENLKGNLKFHNIKNGRKKVSDDVEYALKFWLEEGYLILEHMSEAKKYKYSYTVPIPMSIIGRFIYKNDIYKFYSSFLFAYFFGKYKFRHNVFQNVNLKVSFVGYDFSLSLWEIISSRLITYVMFFDYINEFVYQPKITNKLLINNILSYIFTVPSLEKIAYETELFLNKYKI